MNVFIVEKDASIVERLEKIVEGRNLGSIIGHCSDVELAEEKIMKFNPDMVIADINMTENKGISLIGNLKKKLSNTQVIALSDASSKDIVERAYKKGLDYYIYKPVNEVEVGNVVKNLKKQFEMKKLFNQMKGFFDISTLPEIEEPKKSIDCRTREVMRNIGITGECGSADIMKVVKFLIDSGKTMDDYKIKELCLKFTDNYKTMEQRMRRTATVGIINLANMGIEDYMDDTFIEYSKGLYSFEQVRREMDSIRRNGKRGGKINLKKFINGIIFYATK
ncbi:two-component system, response regulator YcbB [Peptoclostridium litorale DSM 5388]|uniref:Stage 0 sporulation protein A homolog n=1 Tax=Peptoclostridium litorale DSM 5388 TaxID=1121324 RepID=A0A069RHR1_PEPLI|nr:DNA-binding domain-containing protein [Peptoclostridium litorale]KDR93807.1 signal transduction response regulator [Peptoclostridium litorale DSM 5388]SIN86224.1 two-component system, response regulator YcbB [Peptoclostridium litorale DSM 5388]